MYNPPDTVVDRWWGPSEKASFWIRYIYFWLVCLEKRTKKSKRLAIHLFFSGHTQFISERLQLVEISLVLSLILYLRLANSIPPPKGHHHPINHLYVNWSSKGRYYWLSLWAPRISEWRSASHWLVSRPSRMNKQDETLCVRLHICADDEERMWLTRNAASTVGTAGTKSYAKQLLRPRWSYPTRNQRKAIHFIYTYIFQIQSSCSNKRDRISCDSACRDGKKK
jgi:hypothetical protein